MAEPLPEFDWNQANVDHLAEHGVDPEEAEEAATDPRRRPTVANQFPGQPRRSAIIGRTDSGRIIVVVMTRSGRFTRVITAFDADTSQKRQYRRRR